MQVAMLGGCCHWSFLCGSQQRWLKQIQSRRVFISLHFASCNLSIHIQILSAAWYNMTIIFSVHTPSFSHNLLARLRIMRQWRMPSKKLRLSMSRRMWMVPCWWWMRQSWIGGSKKEFSLCSHCLGRFIQPIGSNSTSIGTMISIL